MSSRDARRRRSGRASSVQRVRSRTDGDAPRSRVTEVQRARLLSAAARIVGEQGYESMSVARIVSGAGVSRRTFYEQFEGREDCFLALFDAALARMRTLVGDAVAGHDSWSESLRAGLSALLGVLDEEPGLALLLVVDALGAGPRVLERRARTLNELGRAIDRGRHEPGVGQEVPELTAEGVVGAVFGVIHARLLEQDARPLLPNGSSRSAGHSRSTEHSRSLIALLNPLMGMIVLPYLGHVAAAQELVRPVPKATRSSKRSRARQSPAVDPLADLDMRLTYRTLRVLTAIAANPGASNRQVADAAGVNDQGQISKLLARLERFALITNTGNGHPKGEANAWTLTPRGKDINTTIQAHAPST
jgi:AcrR family transcriptional regulator/DNA-binding MarR family transcriptional regulator